MTLTFRRHQLVCLTPEGWADALEYPEDAQAREILQYWGEHNLPLVVARQDPALVEADTVALGLQLLCAGSVGG